MPYSAYSSPPAAAAHPRRQPPSSRRSATAANLLAEDGLQFKDLNGNGTLDPYEDWRLPAEERSSDLTDRLSLEEKVGLMLISTTRMENNAGFGPGNGQPIASGYFDRRTP